MIKRDFFMLFAKLCFDAPEEEVTVDWLKTWLPPMLCGALPENAEVKWIVTEDNDPEICANGEFGVEVGGKPYLYYKYSTTGPASPDVKYREIEKREFGETINKNLM